MDLHNQHEGANMHRVLETIKKLPKQFESLILPFAKLLTSIFPNVHPNWYTVLRILLIPPFILLVTHENLVSSTLITGIFALPIVYLLIKKNWIVVAIFSVTLFLVHTITLLDENYWSAFMLFLLGIVLDAVDGPVARYLKQTSKTGAFLDPLADKLLYLSSIILFRADLDQYLFFASLIIEGILLLEHTFKFFFFRQEDLETRKKKQMSGVWGKIKMWAQMITVILLFLGQGTAFVITIANITLLISIPLATLSLYHHVKSYFN